MHHVDIGPPSEAALHRCEERVVRGCHRAVHGSYRVPGDPVLRQSRGLVRPAARGLCRGGAPPDGCRAVLRGDRHASHRRHLIDGIGDTESLHVVLPAADDQARPGATGKVVPGFRAAVLDPDGMPVPDGTPGLLAVEGPTGCTYLADRRQTSFAPHGWNPTGDTYIRNRRTCRSRRLRRHPRPVGGAPRGRALLQDQRASRAASRTAPPPRHRSSPSAADRAGVRDRRRAAGATR